jgi:acetyl-CoA carboxylase carboxyl transferase subunit alpha
MSAIEVPIVAAVTGEGGSGGALGIAVADYVIMLSNSVYSVIPPEGCAAILMRDAAKAPEAAAALKLTAKSLLELGVIDEIVEEPIGGAHRDYAATIEILKKSLLKAITSLERSSPRSLLTKRYEKYSRIGRPQT